MVSTGTAAFFDVLGCFTGAYVLGATRALNPALVVFMLGRTRQITREPQPVRSSTRGGGGSYKRGFEHEDAYTYTLTTQDDTKPIQS